MAPITIEGDPKVTFPDYSSVDEAEAFKDVKGKGERVDFSGTNLTVFIERDNTGIKVLSVVGANTELPFKTSIVTQRLIAELLRSKTDVGQNPEQ